MPDEKLKLDINYIENIVQQILNKSHTCPEKKVIRRYPSDQNPIKLNMACPICGDSANDTKKKRFWIFLSNLYCVCYNERETDSMSFTKFCKHFNIEIDIEKKMQIYNYLDQNWKYEKKEDFAVNNMDKLINLDEFIEHLNKTKNFLYNVSPIRNRSAQYNYLINRKIYNHSNIYEGIYRITDKWHENVIIILNRTTDKILGMQLRNLKVDKTKRIYKFCSFQEIYNMMHPDDLLDEIESFQYNKMSSIFNFLNVDFDSPIHVFEGYLDSTFFPNSIALVGLETDISSLKNENLDLKFVLDNDIAGLKKSKEMIDDGYSVFLWKRLFNDLSKGKGSKFKYHLESNVKDINKLAEFVGENNIYQSLKLDKYFAKDQFDLIDM